MKKIMIGLSLVFILTGCDKEKQIAYYCEEGTLKNKKCEVITTEEANITCKKGYTLKKDKCTKTKEEKATATKTCSDGYNLGGSVCLSIKSYKKITNKKCVLPTGISEQTIEMADGSGKFNTNAYVENNKCLYTTCTSFNEEGKCLAMETKETSFKDETVCENGMMEVSGRCYKTSKVKTTYVCYEGKLKKQKCQITTEIPVTVKCSTDYTYNSQTKQCEKVTVTEALIKESK